MNVLFVFGTRPEAIKLAPLIKEMRGSQCLNVSVAVTGQHREMLDEVLEFFDIVPDYDLNIMKHGQDLFDITSSVLMGMKHVINESQPELLLVHGDTSTTFAASLAAFYSNVKVGHVEAGLRTYNLYSPWPEEANRQLTSRIANWHFAPTERNKTNLLNESVSADSIFVTGNTVIDALKWVLQEISGSAKLCNDVKIAIKSAGLTLDIQANRYVLITGHRRENFGDGLRNICTALKKLAAAHPRTHFVYPVHLNPNVQQTVHDMLADIKNIHLIKPLGYEPFVWLMKHAYLVLTDSGGIQEEAPSLGKPVFVMRNTTERLEALEAGTVKLVGSSANTIFKWTSDLLLDPVLYDEMAQAKNPYGDGMASKRIVDHIEGFIKQS